MMHWEKMSKKLREKLDHLRFVGSFDDKTASERGMRLAQGRDGHLLFSFLVDETDGVIADAKYQAYGPIGLIAAAEVLSELVLRKNYHQASRIHADLIDQHVRDHKERSAFPKEYASYLNQALSALDFALEQCTDIPYNETYDTTPIESDFGEIPGGIPGFLEFPKEQKVHIIEEVLNKEIRPYVELDAGGVTLESLSDTLEAIISYQGACTTCHASTGSTLSAIQKILRARVHPALTVIPKLH